MKSIDVTDKEAGQRLDKLLFKYMNEASMGFIFKMLRKKNITLNGKKADGSERVCEGDVIRLFLADETIEKFQRKRVYQLEEMPKLDIIYEDTNILLVNKPAGMLSQKAEPQDVSLNEYCIQYLLQNGSLTEETLKTFVPSVCNRLDRNTSGIVICGKSLQGLQIMSSLLKDRSMQKYYLCMVDGVVEDERILKGYLKKDTKRNQVEVYEEEKPESDFIETRYHPVCVRNGRTMLEVELITGKTHQIRAHLASIFHPIIGDPKYGDRRLNEEYRKQYGIKTQLLHAYRLVMPKLDGALNNLSECEFRTKLPEIFQRLTEE